MARTIGKTKIKKLREAVNRHLAEWKRGYGMRAIYLVKDDIIDEIPAEWFDIWESAWAEIHRVIDDTITDYMYK